MSEDNNDDAALEMLIDQTINGAVSTIPDQIEVIKQNKESLKVTDPNEFVYGLIMGMALGLGGAILTAQKGAPTPEDQNKVRDIVFKKIPQIREQIFK